MKWIEYRDTVNSDLYRHTREIGMRAFILSYVFIPGFKYAFWIRSCTFLRTHWLWRHNLYYIAKLILIHYQYKFGITISDKMQIGKGLYIGHFGGIVVNPKATIGNNCSISHEVTIGQSNRGERQGNPVIGDNIYIGPGAKIFGHVFVGNNAAIGANCVVTRDVPENAVVVGVPARVISYQGSNDYATNTDYPLAKMTAVAEQERSSDNELF